MVFAVRLNECEGCEAGDDLRSLVRQPTQDALTLVCLTLELDAARVARWLRTTKNRLRCMNGRMDQLLTDALDLPADERSALVVALLDSLEGSTDAAISDAWKKDLRQRKQALREGALKAVPWGRSASATERTVTRFPVEVLPPAEAEVREAFLWYFERSPLAADASRTEALDAIDAPTR